MLSRVYILFPRSDQVRDAVKILQAQGVPERRMHTIAREGVDITGLPEASEWQRSDFSARLEGVLWNLNLALFAVLGIVLIASLFTGEWGWAIFSAVVMIGNVVGGYYFVTHVPRAHMDECREAIRHGEVLLLVDVPRYRIKTVENALRHSHPEAELGGIGWALESLPV